MPLKTNDLRFSNKEGERVSDGKELAANNPEINGVQAIKSEQKSGTLNNISIIQIK